MEDLEFHITGQPQEIGFVSADPDELDVRTFVTRMRQAYPVRLAAEALLRGEKPRPSDAYELAASLASFSSGKWRERCVAAWALGRAAESDEERGGAAKWLEHVVEQYPRNEPVRRLLRSFRRTAMALACFSFLIALIAVIAGGAPAPALLFVPIFAGAFGAIPLGLLALPISAWVDRRRLNRVRAVAVRSMGKLGRPELAGTLANAYYDSDRNVKDSAAQALEPTLKAITADHLGRLPFETVPRLCRLLNAPQEELVLDVLAALDLVGDSRAIRSVAWLERKGSTGQIRAEAGQVHRTLVKRHELALQAGRLLRPADSPIVPDKSLLRPAESATHESNVLLRATDDAENETVQVDSSSH